MRAALLHAGALRAAGTHLPPFPLPATLELASGVHQVDTITAETALIEDAIAEATRAINDLIIESGSALQDGEIDDDEDEAGSPELEESNGDVRNLPQVSSCLIFLCDMSL